jgi:hypothetical protein
MGESSVSYKKQNVNLRLHGFNNLGTKLIL